MEKIEVVVRFTFEGEHSWPECPYDDVGFLRYTHRHLFHVEARKTVTHAEREVEIIRLKRSLERYAHEFLRGPHTFSCETMARMLSAAFDLSRCAVLEDGENGAEVTHFAEVTR